MFRELDRPFETAPKTTRESTSTRSQRARVPSRVQEIDGPGPSKLIY